METIIDPVSIDLIKAELTPEKMLCKTNKADNEIYIVDAFDSPNVMREIGRIREISFREGGSGTGLSIDIDKFDTMERPYKQIVIWDPESESILGGYRFLHGMDAEIDETGQPVLATSHMFHFSKAFVDNYLPHTIELGRSFVIPKCQNTRQGAKMIYALDNLWDGIAGVMLQHPEVKYLFGKMTMKAGFDRPSRDIILHFLWKHFKDADELVCPKAPIMPETNPRILDLILKDSEFKPDYRNMKDAVHKLGTNIPPLFNSYMRTSPAVKMFGTGINDEFNDAEETAILVDFTEVYEDVLERHTMPYLSSHTDQFLKDFRRHIKLAKNNKVFMSIMEKLRKK